MEKIKFYINNTELSADADSTILEAASSAGIHIPTLCSFKDFAKDGLCRICLVEIEGQSKLQPACATKVREGMKALTHSKRVLVSRRKTLDLICSSHRMDCEYCSRYGNCELHSLVRELGLDDRKYMRMAAVPKEDNSSPCIVRDMSKCFQCRRCVSACSAQGMDIIATLNRGSKTCISAPLPLSETSCIGCGQCVTSCPTGALRVKDDTTEVWKAIRNRGTHVLAIVSPYVAENMGKHLHGEINCNGKLAALLHRMGFDTVIELEHSQDNFVILNTFNENLPAVSARCPATAKYIKNRYPKLSGNLVYPASSASNIASLFKENESEKNIFAVSISPCTAAKHTLGESLDAALTSAELENMIQRACISRFTMNEVWGKLPTEEYDPYPSPVSYVQMNTIHAEHISELAKLLKTCDSNSVIEIMACPGGCKNGGGRYLD